MRTLVIFLGLSTALAASILGGCGSVDVICDPGPCGTGGGSASSTGAGPTTVSATSSTGVSGGAMCGGFGNLSCGPTEYCDFPDNICGAADGSGICKPRPMGCPDIYLPTCACDGKVHSNPCDANGAGFDVNDNGGCEAPMGKFSCGSTFCEIGVTYCRHSISDVGGEPSSHECISLPPLCGNPASCACLANEPCGSSCSGSNDGGFAVTCPGG